MTPFTTYSYLPMRRCAASYTVNEPAHVEPIRPPAVVAPGDELALRDGFDPVSCATIVGGGIRVGERFSAVLEDVVVQRRVLSAERYLVLPAPGVVAAESYHDEATARHLYRGPVIHVSSDRGGEKQLELNVYDPVPEAQTVTIEEPRVMLASVWQDNYAHWLLETLPRLWAWSRHDVVLPTWAPKSFQEETLCALGCPPSSRIMPDAPAIRFRTLRFPSMIAPGGFSRVQVNWLNSNLRPALDTWESAVPRRRRLYISRDDAEQRRVANNADVSHFLAREGFERWTLRGMTVKAQIELFSDAVEIVIAHGAGCANLVFAPPGCRVLELVPESYRHPMYWWLSSMRGLRYARLPCPDVGEKKHMSVPLGLLAWMIAELRRA